MLILQFQTCFYCCIWMNNCLDELAFRLKKLYVYVCVFILLYTVCNEHNNTALINTHSESSFIFLVCVLQSYSCLLKTQHAKLLDAKTLFSTQKQTKLELNDLRIIFNCDLFGQYCKISLNYDHFSKVKVALRPKIYFYRA